MSGHLLDAQEAGALLNVPPTWVLAEARADRIPHVRLGRYVRFDPDELLSWARNRQQGPVQRASNVASASSAAGYVHARPQHGSAPAPLERPGARPTKE